MSADSAGTIACAASHKLAGLPAVNMVHQLPFADRLGPFQAHEVSGFERSKQCICGGI